MVSTRFEKGVSGSHGRQAVTTPAVASPQDFDGLNILKIKVLKHQKGTSPFSSRPYFSLESCSQKIRKKMVPFPYLHLRSKPLLDIHLDKCEYQAAIPLGNLAACRALSFNWLLHRT